MKSFTRIPGVPPETVYEVMVNPAIRKQWDKAVSNFELIEDHPDEGRSILYYMIKTPIGVSNRDFLQQRKVKFGFPRHDMITLHFKSVKHPSCPEKANIIRAETLISGYILERAVNNDGSVDTSIIMISQNDIKGVLPKSIVNMISVKGPKQWVA
jgi:hypothetical protein